MKRTPLKRKTPMKRGGRLKRTGLSRTTRINPVNKTRRAKTSARNFGERGQPVRDMGCLCAGPLSQGRIGLSHCMGDIQAAHVIARGMGGAKGDRRDLVPLCARHHEEAGERGTSKRAAFQDAFGLDLDTEAKRIASLLDDQGIP